MSVSMSSCRERVYHVFNNLVEYDSFDGNKPRTHDFVRPLKPSANAETVASAVLKSTTSP
jgi:hypothetical protein